LGFGKHHICSASEIKEVAGVKSDHVHQYDDNWKCIMCGYVLSKELWDLETRLKAKAVNVHEKIRRFLEDNA